MSMHQYIGARYVPRFMGTHDLTQIYEALDVVDNGLGTSYISKIPTPAGTPLTDTTHWAIYGASSGAVVNLQNQIDTIVNTDIPGLEAEIDEKEKNISSRSFCFLGDSYDRLWPSDSWVDTAAQTAGIMHYSRITAGGYGFYADGTNKWETLLSNNIPADAADVTDVVIGGGTNDAAAATADVIAAMASFDTYIKSIFPKLERVYISYMGWSHLNATQKGQHRTMYRTYLNQALSLGWRWLENVEYIMHNPVLIYRGGADRVHPTQAGVQQLGYAVAQALMNGSTHYSAIPATEMSPVTANLTGSNVTLSTFITDNMSGVYFPSVDGTAAQNLSSSFELLESADEINFPQYIYFPVFAAVNWSTFVPALLFSDDTKKIKLWLRAGATISSGDHITVDACQLNFPTI